MAELPAHQAESGKANYFDWQKQLIFDELDTILSSVQFENAPIVSAFLEYVVNEHLAGRDEYIKAYTIATEGLGRSENFDPTSDTIVRTTAGRLRKTLESYYSTCELEPQVVISLPKGRYVPTFEFTRQPLLPVEPIPPQRHRSSVSASHLAMFAVAAALIAVGLAAILIWWNQPDTSPAGIVVEVHATRYTTPEEEMLAKTIDFRLTVALARIGVAEIVPPGSLSTAGASDLTVYGRAIPFALKVAILHDGDPNLLWRLEDSGTGRILWTGSEPISGTEPGSLNLAVDRLAFHVLGMGGAVPLVMEKYYGNVFDRSTCISRSQIVGIVEDNSVFPAMRDCLERIVATSPNDASAWAVLSMMYTDRSRFFGIGSSDERAAMVKKAESAAERAARLSPTAYLTKTALMHLMLRQGRIDDFDRLQREIRSRYPGDIFLQIRIATRLARLGRSKEALEIFQRAENEYGVNLRNWEPGIAVAYFVEGNFEQAHQEIMRSDSELRFVLMLKAAILGKLGQKDEAAPVIIKLLKTNPDFQETFHSWLIDLGWSESVIRELADGLSKAGLALPFNERMPVDPSNQT